MVGSGKLLFEVWKIPTDRLNLSMLADTSTNTEKNKEPVAKNYKPKILGFTFDFELKNFTFQLSKQLFG